MDKYPLEALKGIREHRLDKFMKDRLLKQKLLEQANNMVLQKEQEIKDYHEWRIAEEARRYASIMNNKYSIEKIQKFNLEIKNLSIKELELEEEKKQLQQKVEIAKKDFHNAENIEKESRKKLQKLEAHQEIWINEQKIVESKQEDQEMEDFVGRNATKF